MRSVKDVMVKGLTELVSVTVLVCVVVDVNPSGVCTESDFMRGDCMPNRGSCVNT